MSVRLRRLCGAAGLALLVMLVLSPTGLAQPTGDWVIEPVFTLNDVGEDLSLAIDSADQLHISYFDTTNDNILYSYYDGSFWVIEIVEHLELPPSIFGTNIEGTSIALDNNNVPHIAYHDGASLKYASRTGVNDWDVEFVDTSGDFVGMTPSLAIGSLNQPFIAYRASDPNDNGDIRFAYEAAGAWQVQTVSGDDNRRSVAMTLDASDRPHIVYTDLLLNDVYYAAGENVSTDGNPVYAWTTEIVDETGGGSGTISIEVVSIGDVHVAYYDGALQYARRYAVDGTWTYEVVDPGDRAGDYNSLEIDNEGWPRISYYDIANNAIKYAHFSLEDGWQTEVVDPLGEAVTGAFDGFTSLAFDSQNRPHIAYHNPDNHDLMHATREFGGPPANSPPTVDAGGDYSGAEGSPIALDATISDPDNDPFSTAWGYGDPNVAACTFGNPHQANTTFTCTDDGTFTVSLQAHDGNHDPVIDHATVTVSNVDPQVDLSDDVEIFLGETFSLDGEFTDPGTDDTHDATVDYDDGSGEQALALNADKTFSLSHVYTAIGKYQVQVCVYDDDGGHGCGNLEVTVSSNEPPEVDAGEDYSGTEGSPITFDATVSDPDDDPLITGWSYVNVSAEPGTSCFGDATVVDTTFTCDDDGVFTFTLQAADGYNLPPTIDTATVTISNANPQVDLGDDDEIDEGDTFTTTGSFSDPGAHDTHTATVDYGDGSGEQGLTLNVDNDTFALSHTYLDNGQYTVEVCIIDDDGGQACDILQVTVANVAPTVEATTSVSHGRVTVTVEATDPAGINDPLSYSFDCDNDEDYDVGPQPERSVTCLLGPFEGSFVIGVQVDDGDEGVTDATVTVNVATNLCASNHTGVLRYSATCQDHETAVIITGEASVTVCASRHNGLLRLPLTGLCAGHETSYLLPENGPLSVCVNTYTQALRVVGDIEQCTSREHGRVIGATEIGDVPPPRRR